MSHTEIMESSVDYEYGSMYNQEWVQALLRQVTGFVQDNRNWIGMRDEQPQRVLDYACGNGALSRALAQVSPKAKFRGIDIEPGQVRRFNNEAAQNDGKSRSHPMFAIQGDLYIPSPAMEDAQWYDFDVAIMSMALHHVHDPVDMLRRLAARLHKGGSVVVVEWVQDRTRLVTPDENAESCRGSKLHAGHSSGHHHKGPPGFTTDSMEQCMKDAGLIDIEIRLHPQLVDLGDVFGEEKQPFYAKGHAT